MKKNVALFDSTAKQAEAFIQGLEAATQEEWEALVLRANQGRKNKLVNFLRYVKYFTFPFVVFLNRKKYNHIIGWQAFYGLLFAFYCRVFRVKKVNTLLIKNLVYKPKKGWIGKLYFAFMRYIITSDYVDIIVCSSERYCTYCAETFGVPKDKFCFVPFGVNDFTNRVEPNPSAACDYILALGRSNRDWDFLIDGLKDCTYPVKIVCDELKRNDLPEHIRIYNNVWHDDAYRFVRDCRCVIIPIKDGDIVAGETVLIQAMSFSKPIIITKPSCLADDYVTDGENGLVVPKEKQALLAAVRKLMEDQTFYQKLAVSCRKTYEDKHSLYSFGVNVGIVLTQKG